MRKKVAVSFNPIVFRLFSIRWSKTRVVSCPSWKKNVSIAKLAPRENVNGTDCDASAIEF